MYSEELNKAIHIAKQLAKEYHNKFYSPAHLLKAVLHKDLPLLNMLYQTDIDVYYIDEWADVHLENYHKISKPESDPPPDDHTIALLDEAENIKIKLNKDEPDLLCVFIAAITPGVGFTYDQLKSMPVLPSELIEKFSAQGAKISSSPSGATPSFLPGNSALDKYCIHKNVQASEGKFSNLIGRDRELKMIAEILGRKSKPHVIVQGEPGVGKTALIESFIQKIHKEDIVPTLKNSNVFEIDTGSLFSGASYKGEVEDRLQNIFKDIKRVEKPIVFIDDIHVLFDKNNSGSGISGIFKSELTKGEITFIGTTSFDHYRKTIEQDEALTRRFETIALEEPDNELAFRVLKTVIPTFETFHQLTVEDDALKESIRLAKRYLKEKSLPDSAIDLIDRTLSAIKVSEQSLDTDLNEIKESLVKLDSGKSKNDKTFQEQIDWVYMDIKNKISPLILSRYDTENTFKFDPVKKKIKYLEKLVSDIETHKSQNAHAISIDDLTSMVSIITGITAGKVQVQERERLMEMEDTLKKRVIGQDFAVKVISESIIESRSGLSKPGQPIGSFFFSGPTGTGKTELAKTLAEFLFGDENAIIRFDMSEFKEEHSAALLYGAPPGYVGYEEGGVLVNKIRQKPYSIVLFDEIEKAHQSVFDVFLQIMDEGKLHDRLGKEGDFSNAVVLFTSNIGSEYITRSIDKGKFPTSNDLMDIMSNYFRPEFLARLTEIVPFASITEQYVPAIFDLHLKKELLNLTEKMGILLEIEDHTKTYLAELGFSPVYGVRPLKSIIRNRLKRPLSRMIIAGEITIPGEVKVYVKENDVCFEPKALKDEKVVL